MIVPCYGDGPLVGEAVASIQEEEAVEIVVVDDSSEDNATHSELERLERGGHRVLRHESNRGVSQARNTGLEATEAPFVFPLDSDDLAIPGRLGQLADTLEREPSGGMVFGDYLEFGDSEILRAVPERLDPYRLAYTNEYPASALFRRSVLESIGGFCPGGYDGVSYEDWNLWMTLAEDGEQGLHAGIGLPIYRRRLHGQRKLHAGKRRHPELYAKLRATHPRLFASLGEYRRTSDLPLVRKFLYPAVYGSRRRYAFERLIKARLDSAGVWTLRR